MFLSGWGLEISSQVHTQDSFTPVLSLLSSSPLLLFATTCFPVWLSAFPVSWVPDRIIRRNQTAKAPGQESSLQILTPDSRHLLFIRTERNVEIYFTSLLFVFHCLSRVTSLKFIVLTSDTFDQLQLQERAFLDFHDFPRSLGGWRPRTVDRTERTGS